MTRRSRTPAQRRAMFARMKRQPGTGKGRAPRKGKLDAFVRQHERLVGKIVANRMRKLGGQPGDPAELRKELMQAGRIALWDAGRRYDPRKAKATTFAYRHVDGAVGRALKRQPVVRVGEREVRRRGRLGIELPKTGTLAGVDVGADAAAAAWARAEAGLRVRKLLSLLPKRDAEILAASAEMSQGQLAKRFKLSKTRVNQILQRSRKTLREREAA